MSNTLPQLPNDYVPFHDLDVCGNHLIRGKAPIKLGDNIPLLVGNGAVPLIWLFTPTTKKGKEWKPVVTMNKSLTKKITVTPSQAQSSVTIATGTATLIEVLKLSESHAAVVQLDLRPLGLDIYGDTNGLYVGTNVFTGNTFEASTMLSIVELKVASAIHGQVASSATLRVKSDKKPKK